jgi:hypothetical protein
MSLRFAFLALRRCGVPAGAAALEKKKKKKKKLFACRALWAERPGHCLLRVHCRCAALLVLC